MRTVHIKGKDREYSVVPPTGFELAELDSLLRLYFPSGDIDGWFSHAEPWRKEQIRRMWEPYCAITGEFSREVHEIVPQGMGERKSTLVPWNMIVLSHQWHMLIHSGRVKIEVFDPLAHVLKLSTRMPGAKLPPALWFGKPSLQREKTKGAVM